MLTHFSLFSGIGGLDLAATWAGFTTVGFCEIDEFCQAVLRKHWPGVPIWRDVRDVTAESIRAAGIGTVDLVSAGVPCQPASCAGKRRGTADDRYLWPEAIRVVKEIRPKWCFFENPTGILSLQGGVPFESVLSDLETEGYETWAFIIPACAVGAPHRRDRVWIVANANCIRCQPDNRRRSVYNQDRNSQSALQQYKQQQGISGNDTDVADTGSKRLQEPQQKWQYGRSTTKCGERSTQSGLGMFLDGLPSRLAGHRWPAPCGCEQYEWEPPRVIVGKVPYRRQRLQALGNAVVPAQTYQILKAIAEVSQCVQEAESTTAR